MPRENKLYQLPFRFFGPIPMDMSIVLSELLLDDSALRNTLERFAAGMMEPRELAYEIQILMESNYARITNSEPDAIDAFKDQRDL